MPLRVVVKGKGKNAVRSVVLEPQPPIIGCAVEVNTCYDKRTTSSPFMWELQGELINDYRKSVRASMEEQHGQQ